MPSSIPTTFHIPREGELFAGKYRIEERLGTGAMGVVLAARHEHLDERVAIKVLLPEVAQDREIVTRFLREARAAAKIRSEHVTRVLDAGVSENAPYLVMEYLDGMDLSELFCQLEAHLVVDYVLQASEALAEAHAHGIVHRDLKPSNLFLTARPDGSPCIKVLDFGVSKAPTLTGGESELTKTSSMMGSPLYMSPEQFRSARRVDARADIWGLGIILYELIAGVPPFDGESLVDVFVQITRERARPLRALRPQVHPGLEAVIMKCLEKEPHDRFSDIAAFALAIAPFGTEGSRLSAERIARVIQGSRPSMSAPEFAVSLPSTPSIGPAVLPTDPPPVARALAPVRRVIDAVLARLRSDQRALWGAAVGVVALGLFVQIACGIAVRNYIAERSEIAAAAAGVTTAPHVAPVKPIDTPAETTPPAPPKMDLGTVNSASPPKQTAPAKAVKPGRGKRHS